MHTPLKRIITITAMAVFMALPVADNAQAGVFVSVGVPLGIPAPAYYPAPAAPVYAPPAPVAYAPPPAYAVAAPAPAVYAAPAPYYYGGYYYGGYYRGYRGWH